MIAADGAHARAHLYFAFGSNLDVDPMAQRCPGSAPRFRARLDDHRLAFTHLSQRWGGGAADVLGAAGEVVWGRHWELPAEYLARLSVHPIASGSARRR